MNMNKKEVMMIGIFLIIIIFTNILVGAIPNKIKENDNKIKVVLKLKEPNHEKGLIIKTKKTDLEIYNEKIELKNMFIRQIGKEKIYHEFKDSIVLSINQDELNGLKNNKNIEKIIPDKKIKAFLTQSVPLINADDVWNIQINGINITGIDETVCVIDTGINFSHADLIGKNKTCIIDCIGKPCTPNCSVSDDQGHGTHVAGIVAASGGINGVSIGANLIGVKVLNSNGEGSGVDLDKAIDWCTENSEEYNISVITMSLGDCTNHATYCNSDSSASHINAAVAKNITVIASAGNGPDPPDCIGITNTGGPSSPACIQNVTAVGGTSDSDVIDYQRGVLFQLMAPGKIIYSTNKSGGYETRSGTSMAAPHVAGVVALLQQFNNMQSGRTLTPYEVKSVLNSTGKQINDTAGTNLIYSRINVLDAIKKLDSLPPNVTLISPDDNSINSSENQTFYCNASDIQLANMTFYLWNSTGSVIYTESKNISGASNTTVFNVTNLSYDSYEWNCLSYDVNNNPAYSTTNYTLIINYLISNLISPANDLNTNQNHSFNCSFLTNASYALVNSSFFLWNSNGNLIYNETKDITGLLNSSIFYYNFTTEGDYIWNCRIFNNDSQYVFSYPNFSINYDITFPSTSSIISSVTTSSATISFDSYETVNSSINYGLNSTNLNLTTFNSSFVYNHTIPLTGLTSSTRYYYNITICDYANNCNTSGTYNVTTSSSEYHIESTSGSTGSSGSGSGSSTNSYSPKLNETEIGYTKKLSKGDIIKFMLLDKSNHTLTINEINSSYIKLTIKSEPINITLFIGQTKKLNLSSPDYYDISLRLNSIENNKADLTLMTINELIIKDDKKIIAHDENEIQTDDEPIKEEPDNENTSNMFIIFIPIILMILIIFILIVIFILIIKKTIKNKSKKRKNIKEYKDRFNKHIKPIN
jgi:hypothetical protein